MIETNAATSATVLSDTGIVFEDDMATASLMSTTSGDYTYTVLNKSKKTIKDNRIWWQYEKPYYSR